MTGPGPTRAPEHPTDPLDPGMQAERTYLAWQRTGLGFGGIGALLIHSALDGRLPLLAPGLVTLLAGVTMMARTQARYRACVAAIVAGRSPTNPRLLAATAALATVLCVTGLVTILLP